MAAIRTIEAPRPLALWGLDSDNGSEFINDHLWAFGQRPGQPIQFTRSRPSKQDDQAPIEQKHGTPARKLVGWDRDESSEARAALNAHYATLRLFQNLFQPSMKLVRKVRHGSRLRRGYDEPHRHRGRDGWPAQRRIPSKWRRSGECWPGRIPLHSPSGSMLSWSRSGRVRIG